MKRSGAYAQARTMPHARWGVLVISGMIFIATYGVLSSFGFTPNGEDVSAQVRPSTSASAATAVAVEYPTFISIPTLDMKVSVSNPSSTDAQVLDQELLKGAVRYPGSGALGEKGKNVIVFGHSSYLPVVHNQAYKAFNRIQNMKRGEKIYVTGQTRTYVYEVSGVYEADANDSALPLQADGNTLTLVTCDSFASKSDRFVVKAKLVESYLNTN